MANIGDEASSSSREKEAVTYLEQVDTREHIGSGKHDGTGEHDAGIENGLRVDNPDDGQGTSSFSDYSLHLSCANCNLRTTDHFQEPTMSFRRMMSLIAMAFLWTGSQIPVYLFGAVSSSKNLLEAPD